MQLLAENGELWRNIPALGGCSYQQYMSLRRVYPETVGRLQDECLSRAEAVRVIKREEAAHSRAVDGYDEPIYYKGEQCGTVRKFSDRLLELLLMADNPKYRRSEQVVNVSTNMLMQQLQAGAAVGQAADVIGAGWDLEETDGDISASQIPAVPARRRS